MVVTTANKTGLWYRSAAAKPVSRNTMQVRRIFESSPVPIVVASAPAVVSMVPVQLIGTVILATPRV